ncbi:unnamed protein product, partial [Ascophyllum nodosum]
TYAPFKFAHRCRGRDGEEPPLQRAHRYRRPCKRGGSRDGNFREAEGAQPDS